MATIQSNWPIRASCMLMPNFLETNAPVEGMPGCWSSGAATARGATDRCSSSLANKSCVSRN